MAVLGTGGLVFHTSEHVKMASEDLYVSTEEVRVRYEFTNTGDEDETALVAFPLPDITGSGDFTVAVPSEDAENIFGFTSEVDGEPVETTLHQYVFQSNIEYTDKLRELGVPLIPYGQDTIAALNGLADEDKDFVLRSGLVFPMEYDAGQGWTTDLVPIWTLRSAYSFEMEFPAGETVVVEHRYTPSVGGSAGVAFLSPPYDGYDPAATYLNRYCTDESFLNAVKKTLPNPDEPFGAPFTETWLNYIWSTAGNWSGPVGRFHLTIDKGKPDALVSFCWDGDVKKTSPTTFEMEATDWYPPWGRELEVLILNRATF
jgi:hypothetical protein